MASRKTLLFFFFLITRRPPRSPLFPNRTLSGSEESPAETGPYAETPPKVRHGGVVVAAYAPEPEQRATSLEVLQASGAQDVETAEGDWRDRSEEHTSELQSQSNLVCRLLLEKKK